MAVELNLAKRTKSLAGFIIRLSEPWPPGTHQQLGAATSSSDAPRIPHAYFGTPRSSSRERRSTQPQAILTKLVRAPFAVAGDQVKAVYTKLQVYYDEETKWSSALPNFPTGGTQLGILVRDRATAVRFAGNFSGQPLPRSDSRRAQLRVGPRRTPTFQRKGIPLSKVYDHVDTVDFCESSGRSIRRQGRHELSSVRPSRSAGWSRPFRSTSAATTRT